MIEEVEAEEREEVYQYLKSSSYELFDLIENLTRLLVDFELLAEAPEEVNLHQTLQDSMGESFHSGAVQLDDALQNSYFIRKKHFLKCVEVCLEACEQMSDEPDQVKCRLNVSSQKSGFALRIEGPSITIPGDKYSSEIHFSLFNRAKGNSRLAGFTMLRLRNLMKMIEGDFEISATDNATILLLSYPVC